MILVFGGTTEGRKAVEVLDEGVGQYYYSTKGDLQKVNCLNGLHITGVMNRDLMERFCLEHDIQVIVDAAHPFAAVLHDTISDVVQKIGIPVVRFERKYLETDDANIIICSDFEDANIKMQEHGIRRLLALTGVQTISKLKPYWITHDTYFRILNRTDSIEKANAEGFPLDKIVFYDEGDIDSFLKQLKPDAIVTKESGESGGYFEKIESAKKHGIRIFVIKRPPLPENFIEVNGRYGLRREIEKLLPDFFSLHTGLTTGSCATAAAKTALIALLEGECLNEIRFDIPEGETMRMPVESVKIDGDSATATVIKDSGDDPDVTDKCKISVSVRYAEHDEIKFYGGEGVGTVTLPGLGIEVGEPAINPVPRKMIASELRKLYSDGLDVIISVDNGEELAKNTFNPRVGVQNGISIIGTTGIVRPLSHEAFIESIRREMKVAVASGCNVIAINSGGKSEGYMKALLPELPPQAFIHYGNAVGEILEISQEARIKHVIMGLMLGKAVKLAAGNLDTHSHKVTLDKDFLKSIARESLCTTESVRAIDKINFARELPTVLSKEDTDKFFALLMEKCMSHCKNIFKGTLQSVLFSENGVILGKTWR